MAVYTFWDGKLVNLRAEIHVDEGTESAEVQLHPEPRKPPDIEAFEQVIDRLGFNKSGVGPISAGMRASKDQLREVLMMVWNARGVVDALSVQGQFESVRRPTFEAIVQAILRRSA